ncbi:unnamed protein product [Agarophyton chilense]
MHTTSDPSTWNIIIPSASEHASSSSQRFTSQSVAAQLGQIQTSRQNVQPQSDVLPSQQVLPEPSPPLSQTSSHSNNLAFEKKPQTTSPPTETQQPVQQVEVLSDAQQSTLNNSETHDSQSPSSQDNGQNAERDNSPQSYQSLPSESSSESDGNSTEPNRTEDEKNEKQKKQEQEKKQQTSPITVQNAAREARLESENSRNPADFSTFDSTTALNYFHLHKTGGVSFKERLFDFFSLEDKTDSEGEGVNIMDTCHNSGPAHPDLGTEAEWSCDWATMEQLSESERNKIDLILGHQYWEKGAQYWVPKRDLRYFTVMRHPLHRKISFFYHFFVRNVGKKEESIELDELILFLLGKKMPVSPLIRDAGPNYYASRLCSDGYSGYKRHTFVVPEDSAGEMVFKSIQRLRQNFVFIGLQAQEKASLCMLKKSVAAFSKAQGVQNLNGLDIIDKPRERMNTGSYPLSAKIVWEKMSEQQQNEFREVEKVDLAIYKESVKMFHEMVKKFECGHLVVDDDGDSIAMKK